MILNQEMKQHIIDSLKKGVRFDGRKNDDFREVNVEYDVAPSAEGSARVTIGDTIVLAGVKLGLEKPYPDTPDSGMLMVNAEFMPMASPEFESGPPSIASIELARVVDRGIRESGAIDVKKLCIEAGEKAWSVGIDVITINDGGNLMDAAALAALAALKATKFPKVKKDGSIDYKEKTKDSLPLVKEPISVTAHLIGDQILVDPSVEEEQSSDARITAAALDDKTICALQKGGERALSEEEIDQMLTLSLKKAAELRKRL
ncbi:exosome complex protein Rrp42 [Candidatus Woesearchaeota archaeon]|jgi:exosome complex component RRP42|nr:exosome complex protein Rrp42 [Candidatus Woesearchaeota archaeon]MBT4368179.1 exosome complex protein Rrp42 [Candidatus Woesearchaeota archaeon]MBT4712667.1 exosome complex protein Rrp42 [Candidatus Woesearchaeota archaeon]MBT6639580.1 exosome complex protein Rrp42 [Candidatus Woesearchaeota archaeon]MBT7133752.1 exosome complex protein Rrp42 [Candidatus Woesearchaeota archaeon]